jgi:excisionase family DNA binding protein
MSDRKTLSVREAALMLNVCLEQVYKLVWDGRLEGQKVDGKWRISAATVQSRAAKKEGTK